MILTINGEQREVAVGICIDEVMQVLEIPRVGVAVAHNDEVVRASDFDRIVCQAGDRIEIIRAVAGG